MKITVGVVFIFVGAFLASVGLAVPSTNHLGLEVVDIITIILLWIFSLSILMFHQSIFREDRILLVVLPVLALGFVWLLLNLGHILSFGISDFNIYAVLLGWCFFNSGLYYDTREVLKAAKR
jgi:hypothetical protein